jgi:hypothetical protein
MFSHAPKVQHHKTTSPQTNSIEDPTVDDRSSTCCFSNVSQPQQIVVESLVTFDVGVC